MRFVDFFFFIPGDEESEDEYHGLKQAIPEMIAYRLEKIDQKATRYVYTDEVINLLRDNYTLGALDENNGYFAIALPMPWVVRNRGHADVKRLITWVCTAPDKGKIRINMRSDGKGHAVVDTAQIRGVDLSNWLLTNDLASPEMQSKLVIALPICWCGRNILAPKGYSKTSTKSDTSGSLVDELGKALGRRGIKRTKISGAEDMIEMGAYKWARCTIVPPEFETEVVVSNGLQRVRVHPGQLGTLTYAVAVPGAQRNGFKLDQVKHVTITGDTYTISLANGTSKNLSSSGWRVLSSKKAFKDRVWYLTGSVKNTNIIQADGAGSYFEIPVENVFGLMLVNKGVPVQLTLNGVGTDLVGVAKTITIPPGFYARIFFEGADDVRVEFGLPTADWAYAAPTHLAPGMIVGNTRNRRTPRGRTSRPSATRSTTS